jgi:hypothetical protein
MQNESMWLWFFVILSSDLVAGALLWGAQILYTKKLKNRRRRKAKVMLLKRNAE